MKKLFLLFLLPSLLFAKSYTYLVDEYSKETELEAKIVTKIAKELLPNKQIKLYIPNQKSLDKKIYSTSTKLVESCEEANFIFVKYGEKASCSKKRVDQYLLTNNYRKLIADQNYLGAFFWSKSRPNIVFIKNRLMKNNIKLPKEYEQFIEDL